MSAASSAEVQLRALFEQAPDGLFLADLDGRYTDVNAAGCQMLGYTREEIVGKTIVDLLPPEDVARLWRDREQFLAGGTSVGEWRLRRKDGTFLPVEVSARILPDGRWQGLVRDISERKRLEAALRQSEADLQRAQAVAHLGSWRLDVHRDVLSWTDETYRIFGLAPGTPMTYEAFLQRVHPDDRQVVDAAWRAALSGAPYEIEHRIVVRGAERWVHERADLEFDADGRLLGGIGTVQDVTDRRLAEQRVAESEARFRAIFELSSNAVVTIDEGQRVVMVNRAAEAMFGWTAGELVGLPVDVLIPERFREAHREHVRRFAEEGVVSRRMANHRGRIWGLRRDGAEFPAAGGVLQAELGGVRLMTAIVSDVSEQVRALADEQFLAEAGQLLATSLDLDETLTRVGELAVRQLADLCILDLVQGREVRRFRVFARDPAQQDLADRFQAQLLDRSRPHLVSRVLESREPQLVADVTPGYLDAMAQGPEHRRLLQELAPRSILGLPLLARGRLLGALMLVSTRRRFDDRDLRLGQELASRAAMAMDNADLLKAAEQANAELRETVARLQAAQQTIESLTGLLPVCAWCGRIRDDEQPAATEWKRLEQYLADHSATQVTHSICPSCAAKLDADADPQPSGA